MADSQTQGIRGEMRHFDAIAMEIFSNRLLSITESMAIHMTRSSFSTQIKERQDFSVGIFDARGKLLAQGLNMPVQLGSLIGAVEALLRRYKIEEIAEGDSFVCNDPYLSGGQHLPDVSVVTPVFHDGEIIAFAANVGHHSDLGGSTPGSISPESKSIFEEGLRIPIMRIARAGVVDQDVLDLLAANSRLPEERQLDFKVQVAVNERGGDQTRELFLRMGLDRARTAIDDLLNYTSDRLHRQVAALPPGKHSYTTWLDDDGAGSEPVPIVATITLGGNSLSIDFEGTGAQAKGAFNVPASALQATVAYCLKALLDPELLPNAGMFEGVTVSAPKGTIVNPNYPAAVGVRSNTCQKVAGAIFGAFNEVLPPERRVASSCNLLPSFFFSGTLPDDKGFYVSCETVGGGSGARANADGMSATHVHVTNSLNYSTEVLENEFPLLCEEYGLVVDSGGAGTHRGGLGIGRTVRALRDDTGFSARSDAYIHGADGFDGGSAGSLARVLFNPGHDDERVLPTKIAHFSLKAGESVRFETPGGGGFGPPTGRSIEAIAQDLRDGVISRPTAERDYGADRVRAALELSVSAA